MVVETGRQTPEELLDMILESDTNDQLKICRLAIDATEAASACFLGEHIIEIDNLRRHIAELSEALLATSRGEAIDPVLLQSVRHTMGEQLPV